MNIKDLYDGLDEKNQGIVIGLGTAIVLYIAFNVIASFV